MIFSPIAKKVRNLCNHARVTVVVLLNALSDCVSVYVTFCHFLWYIHNRWFIDNFMCSSPTDLFFNQGKKKVMWLVSGYSNSIVYIPVLICVHHVSSWKKAFLYHWKCYFELADYWSVFYCLSQKLHHPALGVKPQNWE